LGKCSDREAHVQEKPPGGLVDELTVAAFIEEAASAKPVPGGGGIAALVGAAAASMLEMALNFTLGKKKFAEVEKDVKRLLEAITPIRRELLNLVARDAAGYAEVAAARKRPAATDQERQSKDAALHCAMQGAMAPPLDMVRKISRLAGHMAAVSKVANPNLIGDVAVAAAILPGAARAAALNVWANVSALDKEKAEHVTREVEEALSRTGRLCGDVLREIERGLCPTTNVDNS
jgi:formiminotetrahydrofolate cyclodeaminase